jgi:hypothetical protein
MNRRSWFSALAGGVVGWIGARRPADGPTSPPSSSLGGPPVDLDLMARLGPVKEGWTRMVEDRGIVTLHGGTIDGIEVWCSADGPPPSLGGPNPSPCGA